MDLTRIDWSLFRSFLAVIDSGSLLGAAKRLGSHQPTLSRQISELEAQLKTVLFERTGRGLVPTAAALAIVDCARQMAEAADAVQARLIGIRDVVEGNVRVAASEVVATYLLPGWVASFTADYPAIQIEIVASNQFSNLLRREADIALRMARPAQSSVIGRKIGNLELGLYASADYVARCGEPNALSALKDYRLIGLDSDDSLLRGLQSRDPTLTRDSFAIRTDHQAAYVQMILAGAGIGVAPVALAALSSALKPILADQYTALLPVWLVVHREINGNPLIRAVFDSLASHMITVLT